MRLPIPWQLALHYERRCNGRSMEKISINLLPVEFIAEEFKRRKFYKIQAIGVTIVLFMIFLSILTLSLGVLQSSSLNAASLRVDEAEKRVSTLAPKQAQLVLLKNRLQVIEGQIGIPSKQAEMYNLTYNLLPDGFLVNRISVGGEGQVQISALTANAQNIDRIISNLLDKGKNNDRVKNVVIDSLNRGRDGIYRINLKVETK